MLTKLRAKLSEIGSLTEPKQWMISFFGAGTTTSKVEINHDTALQISTVYACVYAIADDLSKLPVKVYRRDEASGDETELRSHPISRLMRRPSPIMTGKVFREVMQHQLLLWGNAFAEIVFENGVPARLVPIEPWRVWIEIKVDNTITYHVHNSRRRDVELLPEQVLHLKLLSKDGISGISVLQQARETMGINLGGDRMTASLLGSGMMPAGMLKHPGKLTPTAEKNLQQGLKDRYGGAAKAGEPMILQEGMDYQVLGMPLKDAQFVESRKLTREEICQFFRVPPHIVGLLERATNNNIEHQGLEYGMYTLLGHCRRWEEEIEVKLAPYFPESELLNVEHDMDELLRGDIKTRGEYYQRGRQWGFLTADDIRRSEKMPSFRGVAGTQVLVPVNMTTPEKLEAGTVAAPATDPGAESTPPGVDPAVQDLARGMFKMVLENELRSALRVEADKVTRAHKAGSIEVLAREWYPGHEQHVTSKFVAAMGSTSPLLARAGLRLPESSIELIAKQLAAKHRATSLAEMSSPELVANWTDGRPARDADEWASHVLAQISQE